MSGQDHADESGPSPVTVPPDGRYQVSSSEGEDPRPARDLLLDRTVGARIAGPDAAAALQAQARFLARLGHSGLPCIHDVVRGPEGAMLIERAFEGATLREAVRIGNAGQVPEAISGPVACVLTFIKLGDALAAAHARGVSHGAISSDNIVLSDHGQVLIRGWREAAADQDRPLTIRHGASQEPAARLPLEVVRQDVRQLGSCLWTALVCREPDGGLWPVDAVAAPVQSIPPAIVTACRRAVSCEALDGPPHAIAFRRELQRALSGLAAPDAVTAGQRRSPAPRLVLAGLAMVLAVAAILVWHRQASWFRWGAPMVHEQFADDRWLKRWAVVDGGWRTADGMITTTGPYGSYAVLRQRLTPPVAIEYDARYLPDARPGDVSVWWCEGADPARQTNTDPWRSPGYFIQAGAFENSACAIFRAPAGARLTHANHQLVPQRTHRIRVEILPSQIRMSVDGKQVLSYEPLVPVTSGFLALYGYYPGKVFADVSVWQPQVPETLSALAIGDAAWQAEHWEEAATAYGRVAEAHATRPMGQQALFLQGHALRRAGQREAARIVWQGITEPGLRAKADCMQIDDLAAAGQITAAAARLRSMWESQPGVRPYLARLWLDIASAFPSRQGQDLAAWCEVRQPLFGSDEESSWLAADLLVRSGRYAEVLERFPAEARNVAQARLALGRFQEVFAAADGTSTERIDALLGLAQPERALASPDLHLHKQVEILCKLGRAEEALALKPYPALLYLGRAAEQVASPELDPGEALVVLGRFAEAAERGEVRGMLLSGRLDQAGRRGLDTSYYQVLAELIAGRDAEARRIRLTARANHDARRAGLWCGEVIGLPLVDQQFGVAGALRRSLETARAQPAAWGGRSALVAAAALDPAAEAACAAMPWRSEAQAWLLVAQALHAELSGDRAAIGAGWRHYRALTAHQRLLDENCLNAELELLVDWRLSATAP